MKRHETVYAAYRSFVYPARIFEKQKDAADFDLAEAVSLLNLRGLPADCDNPIARALMFLGSLCEDLPEPILDHAPESNQ